MPKFLFAIIFSISFISRLGAQIDPQYQAQYQGWMQSMQPSLMAIRNAPDNAALTAAANKLAATFDQVAAYWKTKQTADAVAFAEKARDAARAIALGNGDKTANLQTIQQQCGACHMAHRPQRGADPDRQVSGGKLPEGWNVRPDRGTADQISLTISGETYHFAMGPAGTFFRGDWTKSGDYQFSARLTQTKAPSHAISYGLMFGGSELDGANQTYSYFLVRNEGDYYIANREGAKRPTPVVDWTLHPAIAKQGPDGRQTNTLAIQVQGDNVIFTINGTEVTRLARAKLHTDGMYAFRIGHTLAVDVDQIRR